MATKFSIHEDIESALEPSKRITKKVVVGGKSSGAFQDKQHQQQQQRPKLAILNNIQLNSGRNIPSYPQKAVSVRSLQSQYLKNSKAICVPNGCARTFEILDTTNCFCS